MADEPQDTLTERLKALAESSAAARENAEVRKAFTASLGPLAPFRALGQLVRRMTGRAPKARP
jgi:hypothetical protein